MSADKDEREQREWPKRTPVEIKAGTRPTRTRVAAAPHSNKKQRVQSLNALLILQVMCARHPNVHTQGRETEAQREGRGRERQKYGPPRKTHIQGNYEPQVGERSCLLSACKIGAGTMEDICLLHTS